MSANSVLSHWWNIAKGSPFGLVTLFSLKNGFSKINECLTPSPVRQKESEFGLCTDKHLKGMCWAKKLIVAWSVQDGLATQFVHMRNAKSQAGLFFAIMIPPFTTGHPEKLQRSSCDASCKLIWSRMLNSDFPCSKPSWDRCTFSSPQKENGQLWNKTSLESVTMTVSKSELSMNSK